MRIARVLILLSLAFLLLTSTVLFLSRRAATAFAQTTTPPLSTINSSSGPLAWALHPVGRTARGGQRGRHVDCASAPAPSPAASSRSRLCHLRELSCPA